MSGPRTAVVTLAHGRHEHLGGQGWGLARQTVRADAWVVVAMGDPEVGAVAHEVDPAATVVPVPLAAGGELPLSAARNSGAAAALGLGAEVLVFLDVDCIPAAGTVARYAEVLGDGRPGPVVACGEVAYLPPVGHPTAYRVPSLATTARPHPARPAPAPGTTQVAEDVRLFWSLSFAVTAEGWNALGGFDEGYVGYGGEDTDFGQRIRESGGTMLWVGGAPAYHQHHGQESPPLRHRHSIVRNANVFHDRWGWFPMEGWLAELHGRGLARFDAHAGRWVATG
ncbi:galactosyltransferase-related protein [Phycicoccus sp. M110.8]|uniref:glycosyltransferase family 2 protein n=1 Tax=Phycicoccus sp. M110.8 TaxID=3075433 RepID=UPI0028FD4F57|nr:galactosyltransferase-related protein [Phycicoccus sp. M110.8]MDU0314437.1 galactosyltransferase-related protein [Phycicoccus sp. M110.8]